MALTYSNMLPLNSNAPEFKLFDTISGKEKSLETLKGISGTVIAFICNHCPYVIHINSTLVKISNNYKSKGINFIAISSNDIEQYPEDSPEKMKINANLNNFNFPYLFDKDQQVAKIYDAACTPDIYLFNKSLQLIYRGQIDNSRPENGIEVNGEDLINAIDCLLNNTMNSRTQKPSMGCNIKWKN